MTQQPGEQPQQWGPPPQQPFQPMQPMPSMPRTSRTRITGGAHTMHLILTICTCGLWGIVWFFHWLFTRSKTTYR